MTSTPTTDPAPDWASLATELHCPLCEYNLRGLVEPRCPECGFAFTWAEILRGQRETHPYLFEHHRNRNVWSFWKTYWNDCRPRKFWEELNPAQPVRVGRLMIYWAIANSILLAPLLIPFGVNLWSCFQAPATIRFATLVTTDLSDRIQLAWNQTIYGSDLGRTLMAGAGVALAWPLLTLLCQLVFVGSMRRAKIKKRHLLRVIIYGTDYGLVILLPIALQPPRRDFFGSIYIAVACGVLTLYRVYFAYKRYLRFHLPFATVLSSQIMVLLAFTIVYLQAYANNW